MAAPLVLDSIGDLPGVARWCVLVQREIAERLLAAPGDALYGGPSALCALALAPAGRHAVSRSVFVPRPNVDSTLVAFTRRPEWPELAGDWPRVVVTVRAAFAYRRKTLGNALALAGWRESRSAVEDACRAAGVDPGRAPRRCRRRPSSGSPGRRRDRGDRRQDQSQPARRPPPARRLPRARDRARGAPDGRLARARAGPATSVEAPRPAGGDALVTRALAAAAARAGHDAAAGTCTSRSGRRSAPGSAAAARTPVPRCAWRTRRSPEPLGAGDLLALAAQVGSDVPFFASGCAVRVRARARRAARAVPARRGGLGRARVARGRAEHVRGVRQVPARSGSGGARRGARRRGVRRPAAADLAALVENDLAAAAEALCPAIAALRERLLAGGALAACMSGSGSAVFGIFAAEDAAQAAHEQLAGDLPWVAVARLPQGDAGARIKP